MSSFAARLARDEDGGPLVEVAILLPILILFLFGGVDFMNAMYQWNAAAKAVEIGARIAAVSDPIASGLASIADNALSSGVASGSPMPEFTIACDGGASACSCTSGACDGMGAYSADAMGFLVYGRAGNVGCMPPASQYFAGMCNLHPAIAPQYVTVVYKQTGLGYAGRSSGPVPTITVSLNAASSKTKLPFRFFFLPFAALNIPQVTTTITAEALVGFGRGLVPAALTWNRHREPQGAERRPSFRARYGEAIQRSWAPYDYWIAPSLRSSQ